MKSCHTVFHNLLTLLSTLDRVPLCPSNLQRRPCLSGHLRSGREGDISLSYLPEFFWWFVKLGIYTHFGHLLALSEKWLHKVFAYILDLGLFVLSHIWFGFLWFLLSSYWVVLKSSYVTSINLLNIWLMNIVLSFPRLSITLSRPSFSESFHSLESRFSFCGGIVRAFWFI